MALRKYPFRVTLIARTTTIHFDKTGSHTSRVHVDMKSSTMSEAGVDDEGAVSDGGGTMRMYTGTETLMRKSVSRSFDSVLVSASEARTERIAGAVMSNLRTPREGVLYR